MTATGSGQNVGDRYRLVRELGRGGMGVVYLGRDLWLDMDVALKFRGAAHGDAMRWLKREFRTVAALRHPNLVELYELVVADGSCYFTMEYLDGVEPQRWIDPAAPTTAFDRVRAVLAQLADGLAFLHAAGIIHRDVKPANVLVVDGTVKLLDFGLALAGHAAAAAERHVVGTAPYLAPEYLADLHVSPALDVFALGVVGYELLTGALPHRGTLHGLAGPPRTVPPPSTLNPAVPADLEALIARMLAADPARRPTAAEVARTLTGARGEHRRVAPRGALRFVGRDRELAAIAAIAHEPAPRAHLVVVTGPSGIGKSALLDEALGRARRGDTAIWRGHCDARERVPYRALDAVIDEIATELAGDPGLGRTAAHPGPLARVFPVLAPLVDPTADHAPALGDLRVERERALGAVIELFARVARTPHAVIALDDLQWADDDSLELLALLVERCARPLAILATWTEDAPDPRLAALRARLGDRARTVALAAMPGEELAQLVAEVAPTAPASRLFAAAELAGGSPYLAELIGHELADANVVDLRDAERRRLARLEPAERELAELIAIAGGPVAFDQLRAVAELPSGRLLSLLRGLAHARVVRATPSTTGEPVYAFHHVRLREAAYATMHEGVRRARHARYGRWLEATRGEPGLLAYHAERAGAHARAARYALAAAEAARAQLAWDVAADYYARALALGIADPIAARAGRAEMWLLAGKLEAAADELLQLAGDVSSPEQDRWRVRAAEAYLKLGDIERGLAVLDPVLARRGVTRARGRSAAVARTAAVATRWLAPVPVPRPPVDDVLAAAYRVIASFVSTPYPLEALEYVLRGIALAERGGDRAAHAQGMAMLATYLATGSLGRFGDRALASARRLVADAAAPYPQMVTAGAAGIVATLRGAWPAMRAAHADAERVCRGLGLERSWEASFLRTYRALGEYYAGEPARALAILDELATAADDLFSRALVRSIRGRALVLEGDLDAARALARDLARTPAAHRGVAAVYRQVFVAELALAEHAWDRAHVLAAALAADVRAQWLHAIPAISAMVDVIAATAALGRDDPARARATARRLYRRGHASFYAATALRLWAQAEAQRGDLAASRALLGRATGVAAARGGRVDRLAIAALASGTIPAGELAAAVAWATAGKLRGPG